MATRLFFVMNNSRQSVNNTCMETKPALDTGTRNRKYAEYVNRMSPRSKPLPSLFWAFLIGGIICIIGEALTLGFTALFPAYTKDFIGGLTSAALITVAAILTGLGWYDRIGTFAGGGSVVPITGFSNSMTSAAMEYRKEGLIFGTCANMFKIVGPVIVVGVALSMLVGTIYFIIGLF
jgi:stage V sporulation protein AC